MKRFLALAIALIVSLFVLCTGALAALESGDILGVWYLNSLVYNDTPIDPASIGMEITLVLNEDNTALAQVPEDEDQSGSWAIVDGQVVVSVGEGDEMALTLVAGDLVADMGDGTMIFGRERAEAEPFEITSIRIDVILSDFNGAWIAFLVETGGMMFPADAMGFEATLVFEDSKVTATAFGVEQPLEGDVSAGVLTATGVDALGETVTLSFNLHEDGTVSTAFDEDVTLYFQRAGE